MSQHGHGGRPRAGARPAARVAGFLGCGALVVTLDQAAKAWARATLVPGRPLTLVPGVMDLSLVYNRGAAFSMGEGAGALFVLVACAVLAFGLWVAVRHTEVPAPLVALLGCVAGGGVGNAIDRLVAGQVTDFFATTFVRFAVFNVADVFITVGVVAAFVVWWRWDCARERGSGDGGPRG